MMPKCPVCLAAYLALLTGVGVSAGFAAGLKAMFMFASVATIFLLAIRLFKSHKVTKS